MSAERKAKIILYGIAFSYHLLYDFIFEHKICIPCYQEKVPSDSLSLGEYL